ncbi:phage major capsid protein [Luteimonas saliphila]|uniref:phage major capsid protein n=1 Tax=Luteimonas saliphila TaxID=2804919 RepID=UPI00192D4823|nr:phage major capsid protein [Luteimonas saliphila]
MSDYKKQIEDLQATRKAKAERMKAIQAKASDEARTLDTGEQEEFDTLQAELGTIDKNVGNLRTLEAMDKADAATAAPINDSANRNATVSTARSHVEVKDTTKLEPGMAFARIARVKALAFTGQAGTRNELDIAKNVYPGDEKLVTNLVQKAPVSAANTQSETWASPLINDRGSAFADFVEYLRARGLFGQIASRFRTLPFDTPVLIQTSGAMGYWTPEGAGKGATSWGYTKTRLSPLKVATIAAATQEMLMRASVAADTLIRDELARAVNARIDTTLVSEDAAVPDESPAGLRNNVTPLTLTGDGSVAGIRCDIAQFLKELVTENLSVAGAFWVMSETTAIDLSMATNEVGATAFPGVTPTGGTLAGLPVYTSQYVLDETEGPVVMLVKGDEIFLGDEGGIQVSVSDQASIQLDTAPTNNSITPTATSLVSLWQTNSIGFRVERYLNWAKRRAQSVVWAHVNWNACAS